MEAPCPSLGLAKSRRSEFGPSISGGLKVDESIFRSALALNVVVLHTESVGLRAEFWANLEY